MVSGISSAETKKARNAGSDAQFAAEAHAMLQRLLEEGTVLGTRTG